MIIIFLLIQLAIMSSLNILGVSYEINAYIFIAINIFYMTTLIIKKYSDVSIYLLIGYFARILIMLWDLYAKHIFLLPGSGADSEGFYKVAVLISNNLELFGKNIYGGLYTKILGFIFYFTGENRILGQYINVLLGMGIVILVYKSLKLLKINKKSTKRSIIIISLFPNALIFSGILLRENFITFFTTLSIYYFIKWFESGSVKDQIFSIIYILLASSFHSGVIGVLFGYIFAYIFYDEKTGRLKFSFKTMLKSIMFSLIIIIILNQRQTLLAKFGSIDSIDDLINSANNRLGGSIYLTSLKLDYWWQIIVYSPIYMIYFLISPLPWNWRDVRDMITFFIDSSLYLMFIYSYIKYILYENKFKNNKKIILFLSLSAIVTIFIFGIGVQNAGTAMRHRHKILPLLLILFTIITEKAKFFKKD